MSNDSFNMMRNGVFQARTAILFSISTLEVSKTYRLNEENIKSINRLKKYCVDKLPQMPGGKEFGVRLNDIYNGKRSFTHANLKELDLLIPGVYECFNFGPENSKLWASMSSGNNAASIDLCNMLGLGYHDLTELSDNHFKLLLELFPAKNEIIFSVLIERYRNALETSKKEVNNKSEGNYFCSLDSFLYFGKIRKILDFYELSISDINKLIEDNSWFCEKFIENKEPANKGCCMVQRADSQAVSLGVYLLEHLDFIADKGDGFFTDKDFLKEMKYLEFVSEDVDVVECL